MVKLVKTIGQDKGRVNSDLDINERSQDDGRATEELGFIEGRIGGSVIGFDLRCSIEKGFVHGRIGGTVAGGNIDLMYDGSTLVHNQGAGEKFVASPPRGGNKSLADTA